MSYAQQAEDVVLWRAFRDVTAGFYIDVGANHPVDDSVTKLFYDRGWHGINIEPQPSMFAALVDARQRDVNLNVAASDRAGRLVLHEVPSASGLSTFDLTLACTYREMADRDVVEREVEVVTLQSVVDEHAPATVEFLKVDVEGHEEQTLRGIDLSRFRPRVIVIEATYPDRWEALVTAAGYRRTLHDGLNLFFVREEDHDELGPRLSRPANVHDEYEVWRHVIELRRRDHEIASLRARVEALERARVPPALRRALSRHRRRS